MMLELLIYSITALVVINTIAIAVTIGVGLSTARVDEAKRKYWQQRLANLKANDVVGVEDVK